MHWLKYQNQSTLLHTQIHLSSAEKVFLVFNYNYILGDNWHVHYWLLLTTYNLYHNYALMYSSIHVPHLHLRLSDMISSLLTAVIYCEKSLRLGYQPVCHRIGSLGCVETSVGCEWCKERLWWSTDDSNERGFARADGQLNLPWPVLSMQGGQVWTGICFDDFRQYRL